jgi:hypothetical protein
MVREPSLRRFADVMLHQWIGTRNENTIIAVFKGRFVQEAENDFVDIMALKTGNQQGNSNKSYPTNELHEARFTF